VRRNKRTLPELDATLGDVDRLSDTAKGSVRRIESNLMRRFKQGTVIALTIGVVSVGADWIRKTIEARRGCYMITTINGKPSSCKVQSYSCVGAAVGNMCDASSSFDRLYNTTFVLMHVSTLDDADERKQTVAAAAGIRVKDLRNKLADVIDSSYEKLHAVVTTWRIEDMPRFPVCETKHLGIENGVVPPCRMCSSSADPISTQYIDSTKYADNITFHCVADPSILDTITDVVVSTGANLLDGVGNTIGRMFKRLGILAFIAVVIIVIF